MAYTDNNPLPYIKTSNLGTSQVQWLNRLALVNFNIPYHSGKYNMAVDALSQCPVTTELEMEDDSNNDSEHPDVS